MLFIVVAALFLFNGLLLRRGLQRAMALLLERIRSIADGNHELPMRDIRHHELRTLVEQFDAMAHKVEERERSYIEANKHLPVIVLSTSVRDADRDESLAAGCTAFVPKPLELGALLDAIASSLDLEWTWREPEPAPGPLARDGAPAESVRLPMAQALRLRDAARKGHVKGIVSQLEAIESAGGPVAALAQQMRELARQYRFDEIVALAER